MEDNNLKIWCSGPPPSKSNLHFFDPCFLEPGHDGFDITAFDVRDRLRFRLPRESELKETDDLEVSSAPRSKAGARGEAPTASPLGFDLRDQNNDILNKRLSRRSEVGGSPEEVSPSF